MSAKEQETVTARGTGTAIETEIVIVNAIETVSAIVTATVGGGATKVRHVIKRRGGEKFCSRSSVSSCMETWCVGFHPDEELTNHCKRKLQNLNIPVVCRCFPPRTTLKSLLIRGASESM